MQYVYGDIYVPTLLVTGGGGAVGSEATGLLLLVCNAHASGAYYQKPSDSEIQQEQSDVVVDTGFCDCKPMHGGYL